MPWTVNVTKLGSKHLPKAAERHRAVFSPFAVAAVRLLLLTGCRLREVLDLRWNEVDVERGLLLLPDSKTGRKTVILNAPALAVLASLPKLGTYALPGDNPERPRPDLKRIWRAVTTLAGLEGVRLHDLRHTYASFGAGSGLGLPVIGKLLGHSQPSTTQRYSHIARDPLRRASEQIGGAISAAMAGQRTAEVVQIRPEKSA